MYNNGENNQDNGYQKDINSLFNSENLVKVHDNRSTTKTKHDSSNNNVTNSEELYTSFKDRYHEAIIESIEILGKQVSGVVINYLEEKHSIKLEETVDNPAVFHEVLEDAINGGSRIVERKIIKTLSKKLKIKNNITESFQSNFADNLLRLKKLYMEGKAAG